MAKAKLSPMFTSITGRVGNVVFYKRMGVQCLRRYVIPRNPDTEVQRVNRYTFKDAVRTWKELSEDEQYRYNRKVVELKLFMSGYNLYISDYMKRNAVNDTQTETVHVQESFGTEPVPLRSSYSSTPFRIKGRDYTAYTWTGHSPGRDA
jgi:hypothetical protein